MTTIQTLLVMRAKKNLDKNSLVTKLLINMTVKEK